MSEIDIRRKHALSLPKARQAAERIAKQLECEFDLEYRWEGHALHFRRAGVDGRLTVSTEEIHLRANLGMMLSLLKGRIEGKVHEHLDEALAPPRNVAAKKVKPAKRAAAARTARRKA
ncbi:MAG: polyhydroxyalkanoic acid system family protein [Burkholderiales bacterium]|nr:polyhydroxyalkanoic acid system family protein [Burkholderiales bacterium]